MILVCFFGWMGGSGWVLGDEVWLVLSGRYFDAFLYNRRRYPALFDLDDR
jgi:hypothetical protein